MLLFAIASLAPALLILIATQSGGVWPFVALFFTTVCVALLDRLGRIKKLRQEPFSAPVSSDALLLLVSAAFFASLAFTVRAAAELPLLEFIAVIVAMSLYAGQVAHPAAHELIHRPRRLHRRVGVLIYTALLIGHHTSAHRLVHHVHVATDRDPNSARKGEGFYTFLLRASVGSFLSGLKEEERRQQGRSRTLLIGYLIVGAICACAALVLAGWGGLVAYLLVCAYAQIQIYLADYVQHYGLRRQLVGGKPEPVGPMHSWNAPHWYSSAMMLNAPRHSDHHLHPTRPYPELSLQTGLPTLPSSLPVMAAIALVPPIWRRLMDSRLDAITNARA